MIMKDVAILTGYETGPGHLLGITSSWISPGSFGLFWVADEKGIERGKFIKKTFFFIVYRLPSIFRTTL